MYDLVVIYDISHTLLPPEFFRALLRRIVQRRLVHIVESLDIGAILRNKHFILFPTFLIMLLVDV